MIHVQRVDYIRIPVTDMDEANRFYGEILGGNPILLHHRYALYGPR